MYRDEPLFFETTVSLLFATLAASEVSQAPASFVQRLIGEKDRREDALKNPGVTGGGAGVWGIS